MLHFLSEVHLLPTTPTPTPPAQYFIIPRKQNTRHVRYVPCVLRIILLGRSNTVLWKTMQRCCWCKSRSKSSRIWECPEACALPRSHHPYCVHMYPVKRTPKLIWNNWLCTTHTHTGCNSYSVRTATYQPAALPTCEQCPADQDNSQTTAAAGQNRP